MATTREDIQSWIDESGDNQFLMIVCDTFDWEDYPVRVNDEAHLISEVKRIRSVGMQKIMEVYNLSGDVPKQLSQHRSCEVPRSVLDETGAIL